jgi:HEAT repeat protein
MCRLVPLGLGMGLLFLLTPATAQVPPASVEDLVKALDIKHKGTLLKTLKALGGQGHAAKPAVPAVSPLLHDRDNEIANQAARTLAQVGRYATPALVTALGDNSATVRHRAAWALSLMGPEAGAAVPALTDALGDKNEKVRNLAATALGEIGPPAQPACPALVKALSDPDSTVRKQAAQALKRLGPVAAGPLARSLADDEPAVRLASAQALALLGPGAKEAVPQLTRAVKDDDRRVCVAALTALGSIGPAADAALPVIAEALEVLHLETQQQAFLAIMQIAVDADRKADVLRTATQKARWAMPYQLPQFGASKEEALKAMLQQLTSPDPQARVLAALALGRLGAKDPAFGKPDPVDGRAAAALVKALNDPVPAVRTAAAVALGNLDPMHRDAIGRALKLGLTHVDDLVQAAEARLAVLTGGQPVFNPAALTDPVLQTQYDRIVQMFIVTMAVYKCSRVECENLTPIQTAVRQSLMKLGPEAVPALARGINHVGRYHIGFT